MKLGLRYIFFDKVTGEVLVHEGRNKAEFMPTVERVIEIYSILSERNRDTFDYIELSFKEYAQDFAECNGYRINVDTKQIEFSYPDPNETEPSEPIYIIPLSEQVSTNTDYLLDVDFRLMMIEYGMI